MKDLFLDIEALGHVPGCAVIQIGAIIFDSHTGQTAEEIQLYIQPEKTDRFHADLDTLAWHAGKGTFPHPPEVAEIAVPVSDAVDALVDFFNSAADAGHELETVWSWGADYDFPIIEALFERYAIGGEAPWMYYQVSDARTIWKRAFPGIKHGPRPHNALEDCRHAVKDLVSALNELGNPSTSTATPATIDTDLLAALSACIAYIEGDTPTIDLEPCYLAVSNARRGKEPVA